MFDGDCTRHILSKPFVVYNPQFVLFSISPILAGLTSKSFLITYVLDVSQLTHQFPK